MAVCTEFDIVRHIRTIFGGIVCWFMSKIEIIPIRCLVVIGVHSFVRIIPPEIVVITRSRYGRFGGIIRTIIVSFGNVWIMAGITWVKIAIQ
jgi:hypothetical protein